MSLSFIQLNMHKALTASVNLNLELGNTPSICMLTEPYIAFNKIANTPANYTAVPSTALTSRPRAAILLPRQTPFVYLEQLSNSDASVIIVQTRCSKLLLASIYLDYKDKSVTPPWLHKIAEYAESHALPAIFSFDSNAHSRMYGTTTNDRGKKFEEFILKFNLMVENRGTTPTFHAFRRNNSIDTSIDVTLSRGLVPLHNWRVESQAFNGSDHHTIRWSLPTQLPEPTMIRPWKTAKWDVFQAKIAEHNFNELPTNLTTRKIDKLLDRVYRVIDEALEEACPLRPAKFTPVEISWFKQDQRHLLNRTKRKYANHMQHRHCPKRRKAFVKAKRQYHKACRKAKRSSWKKFIEETPDESGMTLLMKISQRKDKRTINTFTKPDGTLTEPGKETITALTDTHFPVATTGTDTIVHDNSRKLQTGTIRESNKEWINPTLTRKALLQFKPNKAAGPDGLKPIVFKHLPDNIIEVITLIYQACISLAHTPHKWRETKVIFLPKPGKPSYGIPKAYRPISLSNYLLKGLERLVVWRMDIALKQKPLLAQQHGFTKGKCTESAISDSLNYIEEHIYDKKHCLGLFLDISSAFDSISIDHIRTTLLEHNGPSDLVEWYYSYLGKRFLEVTLQGETARLTTRTGFPQGGVCSARFWLIAFNRAIQIINSRGVIGTGYADDCCILLGGTSIHNMVDQVQPVLEELVAWGASCGLVFNPSKTVAIVFTRSYKTFQRQVRMNGELIPYSQSVVYLGVTLDYRLWWTQHISNKIAKAKGLLMKLASIIHSYWGPKPKLLRWAYTGIVRPVLSYASMIWAHEAETPGHEKALRRLNRLAMNTIVRVPRSTPTRAMEIVLGILPLHLHILQTGFATYTRLRIPPITWEGIIPNLTHAISHLKFWEYQTLEFDLQESLLESDDCFMPNIDNKFTIDGESFIDMASRQGFVDCNVYTDGSKTDEKVGAGVFIVRDGARVIETCFRLPPHATVFQAETMAIREAARVLQVMPSLTHVKLFVDSQAVLRAMQGLNIHSKLLHQTIQELNKITASSITFVWTKAHIGTFGNEKADKMAKAGAELPDHAILQTPSSNCNLKHKIAEKIATLWQTEWDMYPEARQSKLYLSPDDQQLAKTTITWPRLKLGRFIRAVTGHNNLLYHLHNISNDISPACRFCCQAYEEFNHLQTDCPALYWDRHGIDASVPRDLPQWTPEQIVDFTFIPRINDAFAKPLFNIDEHSEIADLPSQTIRIRTQTDDPMPTDYQSESDCTNITDDSVMDISSIASSNLDSDFDPLVE